MAGQRLVDAHLVAHPLTAGIVTGARVGSLAAGLAGEVSGSLLPMSPNDRRRVDDEAIARVMADWDGVLAVYLFGSHASGTARVDSDVDVAVLLDRDRFPTAAERFEERLRLTSALIAALRRDDVDLVVLNDAPPMLARTVLRHGRRLQCRDPEADIAFRRHAQLRAADLDLFLGRARRVALEALRTGA
ncbi:nucleotidyltransferase domain-containing protein [Egibacter rhizosphaerae]|uniref:Nucleotidyltransferase domain-containing protein n=1 Tax=Egibacter rhizosphaerae TaxID=1670831 RepID=A0A411YET3_9ACTN|nr:nucleotidyltransferase domain-containing protein [Egibacter rhizosphaerae]QBI19735.1 nucleotidyltransferase domain-containing protein [Egibacter rhizosphaerae]